MSEVMKWTVRSSYFHFARNEKRHVVRISPPQSHPPGQTSGSPCPPRPPGPCWSPASAYKFVSDVQLRFHFHSYIKLWISEASPGGKKPYLVAPPPQLLFLPRKETPEIIL